MTTVPGRPITIDDLYAFALPGEPDIAPNGERVVVSVTTIDRDANEYRAALWRVPLDGDEATRLTWGQWTDASPRHSPDGRWIAFTSNRIEKKAQIFLLPTDGGEARQVTSLANGAGDIAWLPDNRHIVFTSLVGPERDEDASDVRVIDSPRYKYDGRGFIEGKTRHIFTIDALTDGAEPVQLTDGSFDHGEPVPSPSGHLIAFTANRNADWETSRASDLWTIPVGGGEPRRLTSGTGSFSSPAWSLDGTRIAVLGNITDERKVQNARLWTVPVTGGEAAFVSDGGDRTFGDRSMSGPGAGTGGPALRWTADGTTILALLSSGGATKVVAVDIASGAVTPRSAGGQHLAAFDIAGERIVATVASATAPFEVHVVDGDTSTPITRFNTAWASEVAVLGPEEFWIDVNGERVQGWLIRPNGNGPETPPVPLVLNVHGGPHAQFCPAFFHELQLYAARGYALAFTNPRGSLGYGESFAQAVAGAWGTADAPDFLAAVEHVVGLGGIDGSRVGITGGSYGGYVANWMLGTTDRFTAGVTDRSISNMISMYGTDDIALVSLDPELGAPWDEFTRYWDMSPLKHVANITAPLLIIHSENDYRCPIEQAEQLFIALKRLGRTVQFVRFPNESHGLGRNGGPKHRVERLERTLGWFDAHL